MNEDADRLSCMPSKRSLFHLHVQWVVLRLGSLAIAGTASAAQAPLPYNSERDTNSSALTPQASASAMQLPPGFRASVFAAEPDVQNPIACAWDNRGRLWVAENYTYAEHPLRLDSRLRDRVLIFEEKNSSGHFSSRKVFLDNLERLTSLEVGFGGVWLMCPPQLLFVPDKDGDDQ